MSGYRVPGVYPRGFTRYPYQVSPKRFVPSILSARLRVRFWKLGFRSTNMRTCPVVESSNAICGGEMLFSRSPAKYRRDLSGENAEKYSAPAARKTVWRIEPSADTFRSPGECPPPSRSLK